MDEQWPVITTRASGLLASLPVLILLPPSEGKADSGDGPALDLESLSFPALASTRRRVVSALVKASARRNALDVLGLSSGQAAELSRNRELKTAGTLPAGQLYTGVLYDNLGLATIDPELAARSIVIFSGLWGALRVSDQVPPYRLSMGVRLPPLGPLAGLWRPALSKALLSKALLSKALGGGSELVLDLRSATYAVAWNPGPLAVAVRVLREVGETRTVVSHLAKATRGEVARSLLLAGAEPTDPDELTRTLLDLGYKAELSAPPRAGRPWTLDIVITPPHPPPSC